MSKHEIEIEGLPEGWELVSYAVPKKGDYYIDSMDDIINGPAVTDWDVQRRIIVRRNVRKYDWSKTLDDVLTLRMRIDREDGGMDLLHRQDAHYKLKLAEVWQPNIHGKCPVDPCSSIVRVRFHNMDEYEGPADCWDWSLRGAFNDIAAYKFIRLADNVEW